MKGLSCPTPRRAARSSECLIAICAQKRARNLAAAKRFREKLSGTAVSPFPSAPAASSFSLACSKAELAPRRLGPNAGCYFLLPNGLRTRKAQNVLQKTDRISPQHSGRSRLLAVDCCCAQQATHIPLNVSARTIHKSSSRSCLQLRSPQKMPNVSAQLVRNPRRLLRALPLLSARWISPLATITLTLHCHNIPRMSRSALPPLLGPTRKISHVA